jgi:hypothetical protein
MFNFHQEIKSTDFRLVCYSWESEGAGGMEWTTDTDVIRFFRLSIAFCGPQSIGKRVMTTEAGERVKRLVRQVCQTFEFRTVKVVVSKDNVHILVSASRNMMPSEIMRRIKSNTVSRFFEDFPQLRKRYRDRHFRARRYFCATVGQMA